MSWWARLDFMVGSQFELLFLPPPVSLPVCLRWSWGLWELWRAEERRLSPPELQGRLDRCNPKNHPVSSSWGGWTEWSPASLAGSTKDIKILIKKKQKTKVSTVSEGGSWPLLWRWWWGVRDQWHWRTPSSPVPPEFPPGQRRLWRGDGVTESSGEEYLTAGPESLSWSGAPGSVEEQRDDTWLQRVSRHDQKKKISTCWELTMSPPWTPLPRRLGANSARSTDLSHSITRWLDHWTTSEGEGFLWKRTKKNNNYIKYRIRLIYFLFLFGTRTFYSFFTKRSHWSMGWPLRLI